VTPTLVIISWFLLVMGLSWFLLVMGLSWFLMEMGRSWLVLVMVMGLMEAPLALVMVMGLMDATRGADQKAAPRSAWKSCASMMRLLMMATISSGHVHAYVGMPQWHVGAGSLRSSSMSRQQMLQGQAGTL
jgi:hypothetical protein